MVRSAHTMGAAEPQDWTPGQSCSPHTLGHPPQGLEHRPWAAGPTRPPRTQVQGRGTQLDAMPWTHRGRGQNTDGQGRGQRRAAPHT